MPTTSLSSKELHQAHYYLDQIRLEHHKLPVRDLFVIEAHVSSCFGHIHIDDIPLSVATSVLSGHLVPGLTVFPGPPGSTVTKDSDGQSITAPVVVTVSKLKLDGEDAATTCERFLTLMESLVEHSHR